MRFTTIFAAAMLLAAPQALELEAQSTTKTELSTLADGQLLAESAAAICSTDDQEPVTLAEVADTLEERLKDKQNFDHFMDDIREVNEMLRNSGKISQSEYEALNGEVNDFEKVMASFTSVVTIYEDLARAFRAKIQKILKTDDQNVRIENFVALQDGLGPMQGKAKAVQDGTRAVLEKTGALVSRLYSFESKAGANLNGLVVAAKEKVVVMSVATDPIHFHAGRTASEGNKALMNAGWLVMGIDTGSDKVDLYRTRLQKKSNMIKSSINKVVNNTQLLISATQ